MIKLKIQNSIFKIWFKAFYRNADSFLNTRASTTGASSRNSLASEYPCSKTQNASGAFTLIEVMVYIALFSILMSGVIVSAYNIIESEKRNETKGLLNNEAEYLINKINWALNGAQVVNIPTPGTTGSLLSVNRVISTTNGVPTLTSVSIGLSVTDITMTIGSNPLEKLNNVDTEITDLTFTRNSGTTSSSPESVTATAIVRMRTPNGAYITRTVSTTSYIRQ